MQVIIATSSFIFALKFVPQILLVGFSLCAGSTEIINRSVGFPLRSLIGTNSNPDPCDIFLHQRQQKRTENATRKSQELPECVTLGLSTLDFGL